MTGAELRAIRQQLGLSLVQMGRALGYAGNRNTLQVSVARYEDDTREIPPWIERLATMYHKHGIPSQFLQ